MATAPPVCCETPETTRATTVSAAVLQGVAAAAAAPFLNAAALLSPSQQQQQQQEPQQQQQIYTEREDDVAREQLQQQKEGEHGEKKGLVGAAAPAAALFSSATEIQGPPSLLEEVATANTAAVREQPAADAGAASAGTAATAATAAAVPATVTTAAAAVPATVTAGAAAVPATVTAGAAATAAAARGEALLRGKGFVNIGKGNGEDETDVLFPVGRECEEKKSIPASAKEQQEDEDDDDDACRCKAEKEEEEEKGPSRLKFPTYEDFLKEEEEEERAAAAAAASAAAVVDTNEDPASLATGESSTELDAAFNLFMDEVKELPQRNACNKKRGKGGVISTSTSTSSTTQKSVILPKFKTADEECIRLTAQIFPSPFQVLLLGPDTNEDDIRKQYRKLSLLIHPDKCKHPNAHEAFQVVNKAYEQLQHPEMREKYREVIEEAKRRVIKERMKENKKRKLQGAGVALLSEDVEDLQQEITDMCEKLLEETRERREYAERTRQANERYEKEQAEKLEKEELEKCKERKAFLDRREERVEGWRQYQEAVRSKEVKLHAFTGVKHQREQRRDDDVIRKRQKMQGIDSAYKDSWR